MCGGGGGGGGGRGRGGAGGESGTFVPLKKSAFSLFPKSKLFIFFVLCSKNCLCSPVHFSFRLLFPCSPEINGFIPLFLKTPGRPPFYFGCHFVSANFSIK